MKGWILTFISIIVSVLFFMVLYILNPYDFDSGVAIRITFMAIIARWALNGFKDKEEEEVSS